MDNKNNFQIYKLHNGDWLGIDIKNVRKDDIIKVKEITSDNFIADENGIETNIVIEDARMDSNFGCTVLSKSYKLDQE